MNQLLSLLFSISLFVTASAQDTITSYLNVSGKPSTFDKAAYFQKKNPTTRSDGKKSFSYVTYKMWPSEIENPVYSKKELTKKEGRFLFCDSKGVIIRDITYLNDDYHGWYSTFNEDGKTSNVEWYQFGKQEKTSTYYYKSGGISSIEQYEEDSLISFELFNEDGSRDSISKSPNVTATFIGGNLKKFLAESIHYPQSAVNSGVQGKCFLRFVIGIDGSISNVNVLRGVPNCPDCDKESVRVVKTMPRWQPGKEHNRPYYTTFNLPISFKMELEPKKNKGSR